MDKIKQLKHVTVSTIRNGLFSQMVKGELCEKRPEFSW